MFILTVYSPLGARGKVVRIPGCKGNVFLRENKIFWRKIKQKKRTAPHLLPRGGGILDSISNHKVDKNKLPLTRSN